MDGDGGSIFLKKRSKTTSTEPRVCAGQSALGSTRKKSAGSFSGIRIFRHFRGCLLFLYPLGPRDYYYYFGASVS
jgi:hypothetical protein